MLGEAMALVLWFVAIPVLLAKSMSGEIISRELIVVLSTGLVIGLDKLIAAMRDRTAVNGAENSEGPCFGSTFKMFSHTIENAGRFCTPVLDKFIRSWLTLFTHSPEA